MYRKQHKKVRTQNTHIHETMRFVLNRLNILSSCVCLWFQDIAAEAVKKKRRSNKKPYSRSIVGATLEVIQKRRTEKPEVRDAAREAALR